MSKARDLADFVSAGNPLADNTIDTTDINGVTVSATEINYLSGATSNLQDQLDTISVTSGSLTKSFTTGESSTITLSSAVSPAPVVSVTKEVSQTGVSSKGAWDVRTDGLNYEIVDSAYDTTLTPVLEGWDISTASYVRAFSVAAQETIPSDIFFKPDGTKMYIIGLSGDAVNEYNLSTAWDISTASYLQNFSVAAQDTGPVNIFFKPDGTKMYIIGTAGDDVNEYSLSTAWDVSTASYVQNFSPTAQDTSPTGIFFKPDGTKMYIIGRSGDAVNEYNLSTAWDISTASYLQNFSVAAQDTNPYGIFFKPDGTKMYIIGYTGQDVNEYSLSTAWDISTASYVQNFSVAAQETAPYGIFFKPDGTKMYIVGSTGDDVNEYDIPLSPAFLTLGAGSFSSEDVGKKITDGTASVVLKDTSGVYIPIVNFTSFGTPIASGDWSMFSIDVTPNGLSLPVAGGWDISTASYVQNFSVAAQETSPSGIFFKPDGTKMYIIGTVGDDVNEYSLSTAWDISTASYVRLFSVASQETSPQDIFFKPDGTKMYIVGNAGQEVNEYNLSTAWDISTASYVQFFYVGSQETSPYGIFFKPDGTKMYIVGGAGQDVNEYNLSTAWNISTASYVQNFSVSSQETSPHGIFFKPDGTKMYIVGNAGQEVNEYNLSTAWDISTASYVQFFSVAAQETSPSGMFFNPYGSKMYVIGVGGDDVNEYDLDFSYQEDTYLPVVTNSSGRIDTTYWTDINTMTADETADEGQVYYAVSTDGRTTWSVIDDTDGVRPIVRNNAGTWEVNDADVYTDTTWISASINNEISALQEALTTAGQETVGFSLDNASYDSVSFSVASQDGTPQNIFFKPDGTKMYILGNDGDDVNEYNLSTAWDISTASYLQNFSVAAQDTFPRGIFFKPDGTKMYITGQTGQDVNEYDLSTAWNISTASYLQNFTLSAQVTLPYGIFFKPDGTKMYILGGNGTDVNEYNLSTAWDISTASYLQNFSVAAQEATPTGIFFKPDGTKMYVVGSAGDDVNEYNLSTAWDISTASYLQNFSVAAQDTNPFGIFFKTDGTKMYITGYTGDKVYQYTTEQQNFLNRMNKTQLDAVTDPNHYTLSNSLDLMIALYAPTGIGQMPVSDGVSINYDAAALNQGAVLGTDYEFDVPASDKVRITSLATQNLKVRVV